MSAQFRPAVLLLALLASSALLAAKPNFSGVWKINAEKSDFGGAPMPTRYDRTIEHSDPALAYKTVMVGQMGELTSELKYTTDGKESTNTIRGAEVKGTARWDGDTLVIDSKREFQGNVITSSERWTLTGDGKAIQIQSTIGTPQGEVEFKIVLDKQ